MTIARRIQQRRIALGLTQADLGADLGIGQSTVAKWENGPNTPKMATLPRLAARLQVTAAWLISGEGAGVAPPEAPSDAAHMIRHPISRGERDLPVLGVAVGGEDAWFELNGLVHEYIERPGQLEGVHNGYALFVLGDSMEPRYIEGEIVYINPNRPVTTGSFVAVEFKSEDGAPGKGMIKQFVKRTPTKLVLRQFNPNKTLDFAIDLVRHFHRIVQSGEP